MDKTHLKLINESKKYIETLKDDDYFNISIEDAKKLNILSVLTERLCKKFMLDRVYYNKKEAYFFNHKEIDGKRSFSPEVIEYAFTNLKDPVKFSWEDIDNENTPKILLSSFFLWVGFGVEMIMKDTREYASFKNELFAKMLQFSSNKELFNPLINEIIDFVKSNLNKSIYLKLFLEDLQSLYNSYNRDVDFKTTSSSTTKKISLPHQIALLNEIGFFSLEYFKTISKSKKLEITAKILNADIRGVKGNLSALNPNSKENLSKYTSYNYMEDVKKYLNRL